MALSAFFVEDPLTRIVSITMTQAATRPAFVYGTAGGNLLYCASFKNNQDTDPALTTITLPEPALATGPFASHFGIRGGSYHLFVAPNGDKKPTFLVCGIRTVPHTIDDGIGNTIRVFDYHALIYASDERLDEWREAYHGSVIRADYRRLESLQNLALVWDPKTEAFYYDQHYFLTITEMDQEPFATNQDQVFRSPDGNSWSGLSSTEITDSGYRSSYPPTYCSHNSATDQWGQHVPDGVMGKMGKQETEIEAKPVDIGQYDYAQGNRNYGESPSIEINKRRGAEILTISVPGIDRVHCVAAANGILVAAGGVGEEAGAIAYSLDNGTTWTSLPGTPQEITTLIAGEISA